MDRPEEETRRLLVILMNRYGFSAYEAGWFLADLDLRVAAEKTASAEASA